jgi:hypothetical protein
MFGVFKKNTQNEQNQGQQKEITLDIPDQNEEISLDIPGVKIDEISFEQARDSWKQSLREMSRLKRENASEQEIVEATILMRKWERYMLIKNNQWRPFRDHLLRKKIKRLLGIPDDSSFFDESQQSSPQSLHEFLDEIKKEYND